MKKTALALAIALAVFGCKSQPAADNPNIKLEQPASKGPAPDFELENVAGGKLKAADLKGKVAVIDFWATWCEPCISEIPRFNKLKEDFTGKDVQIVGITIESPHDAIKPKVDETGIKYTVVVGNDAVVDGFGGIFGFPTTYIVTKDWKIYKKYFGSRGDKQEKIRKDIETLLAEPAAAPAPVRPSKVTD